MNKFFAAGLIAGLFCLSIVLYARCLSGEFVFDDYEILRDNVRLDDYLFSLTNVFTDNLSSRGFTMWTFSISHELFGQSTLAYRLGNLLFHVLAAVLVYPVVLTSLKSIHTGVLSAECLSGMCVLLFAVHPIQMQAVAYLSQRSEVLFGLFLLLAIVLLIVATRTQNMTRRYVCYFAAIVSCALGMRSKEIMIIAPVVILLYDAVFLSRSWTQLLQRRSLFHLAIWGTLLLNSTFSELARTRQSSTAATASIEHATNSNTLEHQNVPVSSSGAEDSLSQYGTSWTRWTYFQTQPAIIGTYIVQTLWPGHLCFDYGETYHPHAWQFWPMSLLLTALFLAASFCLIYQPFWGFWGLWFFTILGPRSSFIPLVNPYFEYRMYLPVLSILLVTVVLLSKLLERMPMAQTTAKRTGLLLCSTMSLGLMMVTFLRAPVYADNLTLWADTMAKAPQNSRAFENLSAAYGTLSSDYLKQTNYPAAYQAASKAITYDPTNAEAYVNCAVALRKSGQLNEALSYLERSLKVEPLPEAYLNLSVISLEFNRDQAIEYLHKSLALDPDYAEAHNNLGTILLMSDPPDWKQALRHFERAVQLEPDNIDALYNLALLHYSAGNQRQAVELLKRVLQLTPEDQAALKLLGKISNRITQ